MLKNTPHLLALIKASEGKKDALMWLKAKFPVLYMVALAADGEVSQDGTSYEKRQTDGRYSSKDKVY